MVFTTFDTSSFMVAVILCMSIVLAIMALRWATSFFYWFFDFHYCVEKRCNIMDIIVIIFLMDIHEEYWKLAVVPVFGIVNTLD